VRGHFYVFVDECHRTQGGNMNKQMKRWLSGAIFLGFTGTPLLRKDRQTTRDVFGTYIHTYKFHQAVADKVILDLKYEARDVPQRLTSRKAIDVWFEKKTSGLNNFQKALLRKRWATMEELMSSGERKQRIIADIIEDFSLKPRLNSDRGTAILVVDEIYDACHYYRLFQNTLFGQHVGIITSYEPNHSMISREPANGDERYKYDTYKNFLLHDGQTPKQYEEDAKHRFIEEPASMKLLIVVSKLLTGFDAPSCTYIYLDKKLHDHNLFQAICRTNRLDNDDKDYGYIVDYERQFQNMQQVIAVYNSDELDTDQGDGGDNNVQLKNWLAEGNKKLDEAREALLYLCEPVPQPRELEQFIHYFCGHADNPDALNLTEALRIAFYKAVAAYMRAFADIAQNLSEAGYSSDKASELRREIEFYAEVRSAIKHCSGEELDIKPYEADMRHLINTYIQAEPAQSLGELGELSLTDLIIKTGIHDAIARKINEKGRLSKNAIAEIIINNVRKTIIRDRLTDPRFYEQMSKLLDDLIKQNREGAQAYEKFLHNAEALVKKQSEKRSDNNEPAILHGKTSALTIYRNLPDIMADPPPYRVQEPQVYYGNHFATLALQIDRAMREQAPAKWRGDEAKERTVQNFLYPLIDRNPKAMSKLFDILKNQPDYP
jgi:type I restriction enzyme R subunit